MNANKFIRLFSLLSLGAILGCTGAPPELPDRVTPSPIIHETEPLSATVDEDSSDSDTEILAVQSAIEDLSVQLGVAADAVKVVEVEPVIWPDASLGCPEPGMVYIQILSPGYRVELEAKGSVYVYHTDVEGNAVLCEENDLKTPPESAPVIESGFEALIIQAAEMLAQKLGIETSQIELLEARSIVWSDASLGCPGPDESYIQVPMEGALIRLRAQGIEYSYHVGEGRGLFLCEHPEQP
ncbi:MAG TPA: hypothetical protein VJ768_07560 [Anaerolineales bacterium]|nr:hypothetical protein [Anaerolineales bacterium]